MQSHTPLSQQPSPEENRNLILAIVLAAIVMLGWQYLTYDPEAVEQARRAREAEAVTPDVAPANVDVRSVPVLQNREDAIASGADQRVAIHSGTLRGSLNLQGARFDDLILSQYDETVDDDSNKVALLSPRISGEGYFAEFGWAGSGTDTPNADTLWQADHTVLRPDQPVTLHWTSPQHVTFTLHIALDDAYMFTITRSVSNASAQSVTAAPYALINRTLNTRDDAYLILHEGPLGVHDEILHEIDYDDLEKGKIRYEQSEGWTGISDKYWLTSLIPAVSQHAFTTTYQQYTTQEDQRYQTDILSTAFNIAPQQQVEDIMYFFAGAKQLELLDRYQQQYDILLFDRAVDFGVLYFLTRPMFEALQFLHGILGNFGLAILALTVMIKAVMFPLANKSYASMSQMKLLMPKMKDIRERYEDDRIRMNQEIMALYKEEGVNPAAGCLPMLLQIPVFFALYKVLFITIEMRHAPFYGWIEDLSVKDPTNLFTLFGLLQWSPPDFLHVGAWPLVMTITMIIQQRLNPKPADPTQAQVMQFLPYMFLFLFASFPAGLVLYWAWNNSLSIIQQYLITRRYEKIYDKETGKRIKRKRNA